MHQCTQDDIDDLLRIGRERYGELFVDIEKTRYWLNDIIKNPSSLVLKTERAATIASKVLLPFNEIPIVSMFLFAGHPRDLLILFEETKQWGRHNGAEKLHFKSSTKHDIVKFAKMLGAEIEYPCYSLRL